MKVIVLEEAGHEWAKLGMSLSYYDHANDLFDWWEGQKAKAEKRAKKLAKMPGNSGENKFLRQIQVWFFLQASRDFWQEFDTYMVGVSKQSASTMHTLLKREATKDDFEPYVTSEAIQNLNVLIQVPKPLWDSDVERITTIKANLPEGWLQERVVNTNYAVIQHMWNQRYNHRLLYWRPMLTSLVSQLKRPDLILSGDLL